MNLKKHVRTKQAIKQAVLSNLGVDIREQALSKTQTVAKIGAQFTAAGVSVTDTEINKALEFATAEYTAKFGAGAIIGAESTLITVSALKKLAANNPAVATFLKVAGVSGAIYTYGECSSWLAKLSVDNFVNTPEYYELLENPLLTKEQRQEIVDKAEARRAHSVAKWQDKLDSAIQVIRENPFTTGIITGSIAAKQLSTTSRAVLHASKKAANSSISTVKTVSKTVKPKVLEAWSKVRNILEQQADETLTKSMLVQYLNNVHKISREQLIKDMFSIGLDLKGNNLNRPWLEFVHRSNQVRVKIHPPDTVTKHAHIHIYDKNGNPLNKNLEIVSSRSEDSHIQIPEFASIILRNR